jgi:hypothetical protein
MNHSRNMTVECQGVTSWSHWSTNSALLRQECDVVLGVLGMSRVVGSVTWPSVVGESPHRQGHSCQDSNQDRRYSFAHNSLSLLSSRALL